MPVIIAIGTNLGNKTENLSYALNELNKILTFVAKSNIYSSKAVDYLSQPDFYNQVLQFETPEGISPSELLQSLLNIEQTLGRDRTINKGPRLIDIDLLFWDNYKLNTEYLTLPHPRLFQRSFVVRPLSELPYYNTLSKIYTFQKKFEVEAFIVS